MEISVQLQSIKLCRRLRKSMTRLCTTLIIKKRVRKKTKKKMTFWMVEMRMKF